MPWRYSGRIISPPSSNCQPVGAQIRSRGKYSLEMAQFVTQAGFGARSRRIAGSVFVITHAADKRPICRVVACEIAQIERAACHAQTRDVDGVHRRQNNCVKPLRREPQAHRGGWILDAMAAIGLYVWKLLRQSRYHYRRRLDRKVLESALRHR